MTNTVPQQPLPMSLPALDDQVPDRLLDSVDDLINDYTSHKILHSDDIREDPILYALASQQSIALSPPASRHTVRSSTASSGPPPAFKARPAPTATHTEGLGPRMTKAAALRQGLKWEEPRQTGVERKQVNYADVPGHKRNGLSIVSA